MKPSVGFVGVGAMGAPMIGHLLAAGYPVRVHARRAEAARALVASGAVLCASPAEAAQGTDIFCTNVTNTTDVEAVMFGEAGASADLARGSVVIDFSTISAVATQGFAQRLSAIGVDMLDCPVSGGEKGAREASLAMMVGGEGAVLERVRPLLLCLGRSITHIGANGHGQVAKACNQLVQVVTIQAIAEAMLFAERNGADTGRVLSAMQSGFAGSRMLDLMGPRMVEANFAAGIEARLHQKDFALVMALTQSLGLSLPAAAITSQQLNALVGQGWGRDDTSSLLKVLRGLNGLDAG
ncbi:MAG: NAD(P)-dependent oxidoreductase [Betaproteobacteria bacterium]